MVCGIVCGGLANVCVAIGVGVGSMIQFHGYGLIVGVAVVVAWGWAEREAKIRKMELKEIEEVGWWMVGMGLVGARLYHVVDYWSYYATEWVRVFYVWQGGLGIWGAIGGGAVGAVIGTKMNLKKTVGLTDVAVMGLPLAQAVGRLGNWVNGELYGKWGLPLFGIEAVMSLGLFGLMNWKWRSTQLGRMTGIYLMGYGLIRMVLEPLRERSWEMMGMPVAMLFGMMAIIIGWKLKGGVSEKVD